MSPLLVSASVGDPEMELGEHRWTEEPAKESGDLSSMAAKMPCGERQHAY